MQLFYKTFIYIIILNITLLAEDNTIYKTKNILQFDSGIEIVIKTKNYEIKKVGDRIIMIKDDEFYLLDDSKKTFDKVDIIK